ncbi:hypothetical protein GGE67_006368, partial [Rhizobium leucaenae]|nr:hypothetical protein [Rhizobium leucaenae]
MKREYNLIERRAETDTRVLPHLLRGKLAARDTNGTSIKATAGSTSQLTVLQPELCSSEPAKKEAQATVPNTINALESDSKSVQRYPYLASRLVMRRMWAIMIHASA